MTDPGEGPAPRPPPLFLDQNEPEKKFFGGQATPLSHGLDTIAHEAEGRMGY